MSSPGTYNWLFSAGVDGETCRRTGSINVTGGGGGGSNVIWVPVVSRANGANNSTWVSDIGIFNPGTVAVTVTIKIWVTTGVLTKTVNINAGGQIVITDVVGWFNPGLYTSAAISITSTQTLIITSRTYNQLATGIICFPRGTLRPGPQRFPHDRRNLDRPVWLGSQHVGVQRFPEQHRLHQHRGLPPQP